MHKRQGSTFVFVMVMVTAITALIVMTAGATKAASDRGEVELRASQDRYAISGAKAYVAARANANTLALATSHSVPIGGSSYTVEATTGAARKYSTSVVGITRGKVLSAAASTGARYKPHPTFYALWSGGTFTDAGRNLAAPASADLHFESAAMTGAGTIGAEVTYSGSYSNVSATPRAVEQVDPQPFAAFSVSDYSAVADVTITKGKIAGVVGGPLATFYPLHVTTGNLDLDNGALPFTLVGTATVVVNGKLTIKSNMNYSLPSDRVVFIVNGDLEVANGITSIAGTYYVSGNVVTGTSALTISRGNIACNGTFRLRQDLAITPDTWLFDNRHLGSRYRLPGYWPTADPKIIRP